MNDERTPALVLSGSVFIVHRSSFRVSVLRSCGRSRSGRRRLTERLEVHLRRCGRSGDAAEVSLRLESADARNEVRREAKHCGVVLLRRVVISLALDGDAVL